MNCLGFSFFPSDSKHGTETFRSWREPAHPLHAAALGVRGVPAGVSLQGERESGGFAFKYVTSFFSFSSLCVCILVYRYVKFQTHTKAVGSQIPVSVA